MDKDICPIVTVFSGSSIYRSISKNSRSVKVVTVVSLQSQNAIQEHEGYCIFHNDLQVF